MLIPMQFIEAQLFIKFNPHSYGYENEILHRPVLQAITYHFNLGFYNTSL
jgi:hypothetical protein